MKLAKKYLIPLCILLLAIVIGAIWHFENYNKYKNFQSTTAIITYYRITFGARSRVGSGRTYHWYYSYSINGKEYSGYDKTGGKANETGIGSTVTVWYNPDNPMESTLNKSGFLNFISPLFLAIPLMLGTYTVFSRADKKSKLL